MASVAVGLEGTGLGRGEDGGRQAMAGTLALCDAEGQRRHTIYGAATPEDGKSTFLTRLARAVERIKEAHPRARYLGLAAGAEDHWRFLTPRTEGQLSDCYQASGYLPAAAVAAVPHPEDQGPRQAWLSERCHRLQHESGAARRRRAEMRGLSTAELNASQPEQRRGAITYFSYHPHPMDYAGAREHHWPIGSGVTEAACKTLVNQRLGRSGMRGQENGAAMVLSLRALRLTPDRWRQFWDKLDRFGFPVAVS